MKKIKVKICKGDACKEAGSPRRKAIKKRLSEEVLERVKLKKCDCLEVCKDEEHGSPPFVKIAGTIMAAATEDSVVEEIQRLVSEANNN